MAGRVAVDADEIRKFDEAELAEWLEEKDIPREFCEKLENNCIDGVEFLLLNDEEVKRMIPPLGIAKKIIRLIPRPENSSSPSTSGSTATAGSTPSAIISPNSAPSVSPTTPHRDRDSGSIGRSSDTGTLRSVSNSSSDDVVIPSVWRADTQACINAKDLDNDIRNDISRTLTTLLTTKFGSNPTTLQIEQVSRNLILKYPFMKDDLGSGFKSWVQRIQECLRNRIKTAKRKLQKKGIDGEEGSVSKRQKRSGHNSQLFRRYPVQQGSGPLDDPRSVDEHCKAMTIEMEKARPRDQVLLPLLKSTYDSRRMYVEFDEEADVRSTLQAYPAICRPAAIEQDMMLLMKASISDPKTTFHTQWTTVYVPAILSYGEKIKKKNITSLLAVMNRADDTSRQTTALKVLVEVLTYSKKISDALSHIYEERELTTTPEDVAMESPVRNSPRFIAFIGGTQSQYYVLVEQKVLCQVPTFQDALFITFSCFYVFHLGYPTSVENIYHFLQDYVLGYPDSHNRKGPYLATASDIKKCVP